MTRRSRRVVASAVWLLPVASSLAAQTSGSLDVGASVIQYDGFLASGAAVLAPALRYDSRTLTAGAQGTWVVFESGNQILQGTAALAWLSPPLGGWRAEFSGTIGLNKYASADPLGHVLAGMRVHYQGAQTGGWASGTSGGSWGVGNDTPLEIALGAWHVEDQFAIVGTATSTWIAGAQYLDIVAAGRWTASTVQFDAQAGIRPWINVAGTLEDAQRSIYGELAASVPIGTRLALAVSAGSYPTDVVRNVLGAKYLTGSVRLNLWGPKVTAAPVVARAIARTADAFETSVDASTAQLDVVQSGFETTLVIRMPGASSVEIMGDFTDWEATRLSRRGDGAWEFRVQVTPGAHRINVRVDGGPWRVPRGTRLEEDEFGGAVGIIVIR